MHQFRETATAPLIDLMQFIEEAQTGNRILPEPSVEVRALRDGIDVPKLLQAPAEDPDVQEVKDLIAEIALA